MDLVQHICGSVFFTRKSRATLHGGSAHWVISNLKLTGVDGILVLPKLAPEQSPIMIMHVYVLMDEIIFFTV